MQKNTDTEEGMDGMNLPFQYEDKQAVEELLDNMNSILKDSDATAEKTLIKAFLRKTSNVYGFVTLGDSGVGKTTLLRKLFGEELIEKVFPTTEIIDYRYGAEEGKFQVNDAVTRIFSPLASIKGISVVDVPGIDQIKNLTQKDAVQQLITKSDVLIVDFTADTVGSFGIWDLLENIEARKVVFVLTKADTCSEEVAAHSKNKLRQYMMDANINVPIYDSNSLDDLKKYINQEIIGTDPELKKQRKNVLELKSLLDEINRSFALRKKQYEADLAVLDRINTVMDGFMMTSQEKIDNLKIGLKSGIDTAIKEYENEIIIKLNPTQIKERFPKGYTDFVEYLEFINESYHRKMKDAVDRKTQAAIRSYLSELENVFDVATGFFRERESMLTLEDKFYGTMAESKKNMVTRATTQLQETKTYYGKLSDASTELFMKLWAEREKYERKVDGAAKIGNVVGAGAGLVVYLSGASVAGIATAASGTTAAAAAASAIAANGLLWPVIGAVVGAVAISTIAKKLASAKNMKEMELRTQEAINDFRLEVNRTKQEMTAQIMGTIDKIFKRELDDADKAFLDFRMSVNIEAKNIPLLEERMGKVNALMDKIEKIERERMLEC